MQTATDNTYPKRMVGGDRFDILNTIEPKIHQGQGVASQILLRRICIESLTGGKHCEV